MNDILLVQMVGSDEHFHPPPKFLGCDAIYSWCHDYYIRFLCPLCAVCLPCSLSYEIVTCNLMQGVAITQENSLLDNTARIEGWLARFPMFDWVGGRTSEMSAVGLLPAALQVNDPKFRI